jgi:hypothetical protein
MGLFIKLFVCVCVVLFCYGVESGGEAKGRMAKKELG